MDSVIIHCIKPLNYQCIAYYLSTGLDLYASLLNFQILYHTFVNLNYFAFPGHTPYYLLLSHHHMKQCCHLTFYPCFKNCSLRRFTPQIIHHWVPGLYVHYIICDH